MTGVSPSGDGRTKRSRGGRHARTVPIPRVSSRAVDATAAESAGRPPLPRRQAQATVPAQASVPAQERDLFGNDVRDTAISRSTPAAMVSTVPMAPPRPPSGTSNRVLLERLLDDLLRRL